MHKLLALLLITFSQLFAQGTCYETVNLPTESQWGGSDVVGSDLMGTTYGSGNGPGIYAVADGGYRIYHNGKLLGSDNATGRVKFFPMTFLPGKNSVSIVGVNGANTPGVMVHIDELEKPYVTNSNWKVSTSPLDNSWKNSSYNDVSWSAATIQSAGSLTQSPSGNVVTGFPSNSSAKWIWASSSSSANAVLRYTFEIMAVGFGRNTTGGAAGSVVVVTTADELKAACESSTPMTILVPEGGIDCRSYRDQSVCSQPCSDNTSQTGGYNGDWITNGSSCPGTTKTIQRYERLIWMNSNKSLIGMGRGAAIRGAAFYANSGNKRTNIIFRNLAIWDVNPHIIEAGDAISINDATKLWVDHCSFRYISDGNDIQGTRECTFSWNEWNGYNEFMCIERDYYSAMIKGSDITFDHDFWNGASGRVPKTYGTDDTKIHMINNYHYDNLYYASESGGPNLLVYVENTHYEKVRFPTVRLDGGVMYCNGNKYESIENHMGANWKATTEPKDATAKFSISYPYTLDAVNDVKSIVTSRSGYGAQWNSMPTWNTKSVNSNVVKTNQAPSGSITAPYEGQNFISPSSVSITANASDADGSIAKVKFYSGGILLGEDTSAPYSYSLTDFTSCTYSITALITDNSGNSIMTSPVKFSVVSQPAQPKTLIYEYDNSGDLTWENTNSWTPKSLPTSIDTAIIRTGEVQIKSNITSLVKVEPNGNFRMIGYYTVPNIILQGGYLQVSTSNKTYGLSSSVNVESASLINAGSKDTSVFNCDVIFSGNGDLTKTGAGILQLNRSSKSFHGDWRVMSGKLKVRASHAAGSGKIVIDSAAILDIETNGGVAGCDSLILKNGALVTIDATVDTVNSLKLGDKYIAPGKYSNTDFPTFIGGAGSLVVMNGTDLTATLMRTITPGVTLEAIPNPITVDGGIRYSSKFKGSHKLMIYNGNNSDNGKCIPLSEKSGMVKWNTLGLNEMGVYIAVLYYGQKEIARVEFYYH